MAITKNAQKAIRSHARKRVFNVRTKVSLHDTVKTFRTTITKNSLKEAEALLPSVYQALDKAAKRGIIKPNTANRKKARLVQAMRKLGAK